MAYIVHMYAMVLRQNDRSHFSYSRIIVTWSSVSAPRNVYYSYCLLSLVHAKNETRYTLSIRKISLNRHIVTFTVHNHIFCMFYTIPELIFSLHRKLVIKNMACITSDNRIFVNNELRELCKESAVYGVAEKLREEQTTPLPDKTEILALLRTNQGW